MGAIVSRSSHSDQSMGERCPVGNAAAPVPAHDRISLAGRASPFTKLRPRLARGDETDARSFTGVSCAIISPFRFSAAKNRRANVFRARCKRCRSKRWCRTGKAIQAGTSHFLGQNFARASGIQFQNREGKQEFGWTTSWGMSTRLVGTLRDGARRRRWL